MAKRLGIAAALCLSLCVTPVLAAGPPPDLEAQLKQVVEKDGAPGVTAIAFKNGKRLYRLDVGPIAPDAQLPIASASKWMTTTLVMTVVDEGKLSLDEPIGRRLPEFTGEAGQITLRQLLSFTAGQGGLDEGMVDLNQDPTITLAESARLIAARPLKDRPGTTFRYGGPSMQVAGALVEQATGQTWVALFEARIAKPLGLTHTYWGNPLRTELKPAAVRNPNLQAGIYTTAEDYAKFLGMLAGRGQSGGKRIISETAFDAMEMVQTNGIVMAYRPPGAGQTDKYALGNWCETDQPSGRCDLISSPGAFGTYPWIDRKSGMYGVFFLRHRLPAVAADLRAARAMILKAEGANGSR